MINFSHFLDLPLIWGFIIALAIFLYVVLDGFDLGVGILFPFAPSEKCRDSMMNSVAPFWDGNETWLVLGGGGLFAAFPLAYSVLMPAFYIPIILMLLGLIFRGVAFEFRFKSQGEYRKLWDYTFHIGSLVATFFQGVVLGTFLQGIPVQDRAYSGSNFEWLSPFSLMTGVALVFGYALLGATWLVMKTDEITNAWAQKVTRYVFVYVIFFMGIVSLWVPFLNEGIRNRWFHFPNILYLSPIPILSLWVIIELFRSSFKGHEYRPFLLTVLLFSLCYAGFGISLWPYIVPYKFSIWQAAAAPESQSLLLIGGLLTLPFVFGYTIYSYYVFRGKSSHDAYY